MKVTLFDLYVDDLNAFLVSGETDNVVVAILLTKIKMFQGMIIFYASKNDYSFSFTGDKYFVFIIFYFTTSSQATIQNTIYHRNYSRDNVTSGYSRKPGYQES